MNLLVLGGTQFVGRQVVQEAVNRGHTVTLFNRGKSDNPFPDLESLTGNRNDDVSALEGRHWDAVVDCTGYTPKQMGLSLNALKDNVRHYTFISTVSVYEHLLEPARSGLIEESNELLSLAEPTDEVANESYGALKVLCEEMLKGTFTDALILRPGFVVGPYDHTDRFTYFPWRISQGGEVLVPNAPQQPIQYIDARDLAAFTLDGVESQLSGTYNVVVSPETYAFGDLLELSQKLSGSDTTLTKVTLEFLESQDVELTKLLMYVPDTYLNMTRVSNTAAVQAGLNPRSLEETVKATLQYATTFSDDYELKSGLSRSHEAELLQAWANAGRGSAS